MLAVFKKEEEEVEIQPTKWFLVWGLVLAALLIVNHTHSIKYVYYKSTHTMHIEWMLCVFKRKKGKKGKVNSKTMYTLNVIE